MCVNKFEKSKKQPVCFHKLVSCFQHFQNKIKMRGPGGGWLLRCIHLQALKKKRSIQATYCQVWLVASKLGKNASFQTHTVDLLIQCQREKNFVAEFCLLSSVSLFSQDFEIAPVLPMLRIERPSELSWRARHGVKKKICLLSSILPMCPFQSEPAKRQTAKSVISVPFFDGRKPWPPLFGMDIEQKLLALRLLNARENDTTYKMLTIQCLIPPASLLIPKHTIWKQILHANGVFPHKFGTKQWVWNTVRQAAQNVMPQRATK